MGASRDQAGERGVQLTLLLVRPLSPAGRPAKPVDCSSSTTVRIIVSHLLPNTVAPIIIVATLSLPAAIATEAGLSFLGLGVRPPMPSWGILIAEGARSMRVFPHLMLFPGTALAVTLVCFTFVGDGLRDALDPKLNT